MRFLIFSMILNLLDRMKLPFRKNKEFLTALYNILGFYPHNIEVYRVAFSHKSLAYRRDAGRKAKDRRQRTENTAKPLNNERLEYLGDAILESVVSDILFRHFPNKREGFLTSTRSKIVQREALNRLATEMGLERLIQAAQGTRMSHTNIGGNAFEALMGAIYLDRGFSYCHWFIANRVIGHYVDLENVAQKEVNFKSKLLEWSQKNRITINFKDVAAEGEEKGFKTTIIIEGITAGRGTGRSKKESQQEASKEALTRMRRDAKMYDSLFRAKEKRTAMEAEESFALPKIDEIEESLEKKAGRRDAKVAAMMPPVLEEKQRKQPQSDSDAAYDTAYDENADFEVIDTPPAEPVLTAADYRAKGLPEPPRENELDVPEKQPKKRKNRTPKTVDAAVKDFSKKKGNEVTVTAEKADDEAAKRKTQSRSDAEDKPSERPGKEPVVVSGDDFLQQEEALRLAREEKRKAFEARQAAQKARYEAERARRAERKAQREAAAALETFEVATAVILFDEPKKSDEITSSVKAEALNAESEADTKHEVLETTRVEVVEVADEAVAETMEPFEVDTESVAEVVETLPEATESVEDVTTEVATVEMQPDENLSEKPDFTEENVEFSIEADSISLETPCEEKEMPCEENVPDSEENDFVIVHDLEPLPDESEAQIDEPETHPGNTAVYSDESEAFSEDSEKANDEIFEAEAEPAEAEKIDENADNLPDKAEKTPHPVNLEAPKPRLRHLSLDDFVFGVDDYDTHDTANLSADAGGEYANANVEADADADHASLDAGERSSASKHHRKRRRKSGAKARTEEYVEQQPVATGSTDAAEQPFAEKLQQQPQKQKQRTRRGENRSRQSSVQTVEKSGDKVHENHGNGEQETGTSRPVATTPAADVSDTPDVPQAKPKRRRRRRRSSAQKSEE